LCPDQIIVLLAIIISLIGVFGGKSLSTFFCYQGGVLNGHAFHHELHKQVTTIPNP